MIKMVKGSVRSSLDEQGSQSVTDATQVATAEATQAEESLVGSDGFKDNLAETPALSNSSDNHVKDVRKARLDYNEAKNEIVINLGDVVDWSVLTDDARKILKGFDEANNLAKPEDKQRILMSLCTLFGWPTSIIASSKSPTEDEVQAEKSDVEAALDKFDSLDRPEISSSQHQMGEDDDEE